MKTGAKVLIAIIILVISVIAGAFIYEKIPGVFGFLGLNSLADKAARIEQLNSDLERIQLENLETVRNLVSGNDTLKRELDTAQGRERETAESLDRERAIHREMVISIETGEGAVSEIRDEARRIYAAADEIERGIQELQEAGRGPDPAMEGNSDR